jgi:hypothetical protein
MKYLCRRISSVSRAVLNRASHALSSGEKLPKAYDEGKLTKRIET